VGLSALCAMCASMYAIMPLYLSGVPVCHFAIMSRQKMERRGLGRAWPNLAWPLLASLAKPGQTWTSLTKPCEEWPSLDRPGQAWLSHQEKHGQA